jgi:hypothetical protein
MNIEQFLSTGKHPQTLKLKSALIDSLRNHILSNQQIMKNTPINNNPVTILGMSMKRVLEVAETAAKGQLLKTLTDAYIADENAAELKAKAPAPRPAPRPAPTAAPNRFSNHSDSLLVKFSIHKSTSAVDRAEMAREISNRRITVQPSGSYSRSFSAK